MSKVLISFLGTSVPDVSADGYRQYRQAKYRFASADGNFDNGDEIESPFIAFALQKHYNIDKVILVGTPKSMWEEVYAATNGGGVDEAYIEIGEYCAKASAQTPLTPIPHQEKIENSLGNGSKIILVRYGISETEMNLNAQYIFSIERYLNSNDEIYIDITHSFRSLPLHLMNALLYLKNVSPKKLDVKSVSYGMLDIIKEVGYAPVVELKSILTLSDWVSVASDFMKAGNSYQIVELLMSSNNSRDCEVAQKLKRFSDIVNLNHIAGVVALADDLGTIDRFLSEASAQAQLVVRPVVKKFLSTFRDATSVSQKQFRFAEYQYSLCHYASSCICLTEAIISWVCEKTDLDENDKNNRDLAKGLILYNPRNAGSCRLKPEERQKASNFQRFYSSEQLRSLKEAYGSVNRNRKAVAHSLDEGNSPNKMIADLKKGLETMNAFIFPNE